MDVAIPVIVGLVDVLCMVLTFKTRGVLFALVGGILVLWVEGWLMAIDPTLTENGGVTALCGSSGNAVCGYALSSTDLEVSIVTLAILAVASFMLAIDANRDPGGYNI